MKKLLLFLAFCTFTVAILHSAPKKKIVTSKKPTVDIKLEDLPRRAIDTVATNDPDTKVIIFSNNTWKYYRPSLKKLDGLKVYQENWDTVGVFAYHNVQLSDISPITELKLFSDLSDFSPPIKGHVISKYGPRGRRNHNGIDIPLITGEPIYAAFDGKVRYAKFNTGGFGYLVIVRHPNGLETWSAHLSKLNVAPNDYVKAGQVIGFGGSTGRSTGPHLHFETRFKDQTFDPERIFDIDNSSVRYQTFALEREFFNIHSRESDQLVEDDDIFQGTNLLTGTTPGDSMSQDILQRIEQAQQKSVVATTAKTTAAKASTGAVYHTVKSGDMLGKLASKYGVSIDHICKLNKISRTTTLRLGQKLRIK